MQKFWQNYSLSIVLAILFVFSWGIQTWTGWEKFCGEQLQNGQAPQIFGSGGYVWEWGAATFENWQSEFLQLLTFVFLTSFLIHKGSHESKDNDEEVNRLLLDIRRRVQNLEEKMDVPSKRKAS